MRFPQRPFRALPILPIAILAFFVTSSRGDPVDHREAFAHLPGTPEVLYLPGKYSPCFGCHPGKTVIEEEDFNVETNFRDTVLGKNLHSIHVYRQPLGTNCTACHRADAHTGKVAFLPAVNIERSEKGGTCAPACHRPKGYRNAGRNR